MNWLDNLHSTTDNDIVGITRTLILLTNRLEDGYLAVSADFDRVDIEQANAYHLLAVLRALFNQRESIPGWRTLEQRTRSEFTRRGLNASRVMKGLS